jgi:hypothetical protein
MKRLLCIAVCLLAGTLHATGGGASGLTFLKLETSARISAMGGAGTALYHEPANVHYNPAGIADMPHSEIQLMHTSWIQDMSMQYGGGVLSLGRASLGISLYNSMVEGVEVRTRPGPAESEFTARYFGTGATFAYRISPSFRAGATGKILYEKLYVDEATGYAFDLGLLYRSTTPGLFFGISVLNIGSMNTLRNEATDLPLTYRFGSSYQLPLLMEDLTTQLAVDALWYDGDDKLHLLFGGEIGYAGTVYARIGLQSGVEARGITAGFGVRHGLFKLDYAYIPLFDELGTGHTITVGMVFR